MSTQEPELRDRLVAVFDRYVESFERVVQEAVDRGDLASLDAQRAGRLVLSLIEGSVMLAKMRDDPEVLRGLGRDVLQLIGANGPIAN